MERYVGARPIAEARPQICDRGALGFSKGVLSPRPSCGAGTLLATKGCGIGGHRPLEYPNSPLLSHSLVLESRAASAGTPGLRYYTKADASDHGVGSSSPARHDIRT